MIKVFVYLSKDLISGFEISGHAMYADKGQDIVCAGVSAIIIGGINALHELAADDIVYDVKDGYAKVLLKQNFAKWAHITNTIFIQLQSIEETYKKNIKIYKTQGGVEDVD